MQRMVPEKIFIIVLVMVAVVPWITLLLTVGYSHGAERFVSPIRHLKVIQTTDYDLVTDVRTYKISNFLDGVAIERSLKESMRMWGVLTPEKIRYQIMVFQSDRTEFLIQYYFLK